MKPIDRLYDLHAEAEAMFSSSNNPEVRNELAQALCVTRNCIPLIENGDTEALENIEADIRHTEECIRRAINIVDPESDTERSPTFEDFNNI